MCVVYITIIASNYDSEALSHYWGGGGGRQGAGRVLLNRAALLHGADLWLTQPRSGPLVNEDLIH